MSGTRREHTALWLAAAAVLALVLAAVWVERKARPAVPAGPLPDWTALAPPASTAFATWRWLVFTRDCPAHFTVGFAPDDAGRISVQPAWQLQKPIPGYPADAIIVAVGGRGDDELVESRLADLGAMLVRHIPTLPLRQAGADRRGAPPGLDQERLRFRIRERMEK